MKLLEGYTEESKVYKDHLQLLKKHDYSLKCSEAIFSNEEIQFIHDTGYWMQAISNDELEPITDRQVAFKAVCDGKAMPISLQERAWFKVQGRRKLEAEKGNKLNVQYMPEEDEFYSREGYKELHGSMFSVMNQTHSKY